MRCGDSKLTAGLALVLACLGCWGQGQSQDPKALVKEYRGAFRTLPGTLVYDIGKQTQAYAYDGSGDALTLEKYAVQVHRTYAWVPGVHVFRYPKSNEVRSSVDAIKSAIALLPSGELDKAFSSGLSLSDLPDSLRKQLIVAVATMPSTANELEGLGPRGMLKLSFGAVASYKTPDGKTHNESLYSGGTRFPPSVLEAAKKKGSIAMTKNDPNLASDSGPLDYGEGELATLAEIATRAQTQFGRSYAVDPRLADERFFVRGSLSKGGFEAAFSELTRTDDFLQSPDEAARQFLSLVKTRFLEASRKSEFQPSPRPDVLLTSPMFSAKEFQTYGDEPLGMVQRAHLADGTMIQIAPVLYLSVDGGTPTTQYVIRIDLKPHP